MIGIIAILIFVIILAGGLKIYLVNDSTQINGIIDIGTKLMFFVAFYNLGYLISIWNIKKEITPSSNPNENLDEKSEEKNKPKSRLNFPFKIKKRLSIIVISMICIWIVISLFIAYSIDGIWFSNLFKYLATAGIGVGLGWIFWEHLKESNMLSGDFLKNLKLFSVLFEIPIIIFTILGIYFVKEGLTQYNQYLLLGYLLLFYLMATYFMGLLYETLKK